jgi:2-polyprenyl-3-methyl-5-hydroxy-6-metoxy-1,4-benzoquinol methylase
MQKINSLNSSHTDYSASFNYSVFSEVNPQSSCLDVGCSSGNLGFELIKKKGCRVQGIDINPAALEHAVKKGYEQVYKLDLIRNPEELCQVPNLAFDYVICADVLEHLVNPEVIISNLATKLKSGGIMIISLPNVAFGLNRLSLLLGNWNYREYGIMDKTHLRFFTIDSGINLVKRSGLEILKVRPYNQFGILRYLGLINSIFPRFFAYQFMIICSKNQ